MVGGHMTDELPHTQFLNVGHIEQLLHTDRQLPCVEHRPTSSLVFVHLRLPPTLIIHIVMTLVQQQIQI